MADKNFDQAHLVNSLTEQQPRVIRNQAKPLSARRTLSGWKKSVAVGLAAGSLLAGGNLILNGGPDKPTNAPAEKPIPTLTTSEIKKDTIKVADLNPDKPPTQQLNGIVMIKIDKENDLPALRTDPGLIQNQDPANIESFANIQEINGTPIAKAVDSNGQTELVLTDPLVTRSRDGSIVWITLVSGGKPLYLRAGQDTEGFVMVQPTGEDVFSPVPQTADALNYGKVSFQNSPSK